jgi:NAD dependent epimerase/dehydratase family enzyme
VWLQASTATIYAHRYDAPNDEATGEIGGDEPSVPETWRFSIEVAKAWERAANEIATPHTRKVLMRTAMVMSPEPGGTFALLWRLVRFGLGGPAAGGRQYVSWIHDADFAAAVTRLVDSSLAGAVNVAAPAPLPYREFVGRLREAAGVRIGLPANRWMLEAGAFALRTETELILKSRRVIPRRLLDDGFMFQFPSWRDACIDLARRIAR